MEDGQRFDGGFFGDLGDSLDTGGACADYADALVGEVAGHVEVLGPAGGMEGFTFVVVDAGDIGEGWRRQETHGTDKETGLVLVAIRVGEQPRASLVLPSSRLYPRIKLNVLV